MDILRSVVDRLGTLKNQFMIFVVLIVIATHAVGANLISEKEGWKAVCGVVLHFIGVIFPIGFIGFYIYALIQLPSSQQEMLFAQTAEGDLAKHPGAVRKRKSADFTVNREKQSNKEAD